MVRFINIFSYVELPRNFPRVPVINVFYCITSLKHAELLHSISNCGLGYCMYAFTFLVYLKMCNEM